MYLRVAFLAFVLFVGHVLIGSVWGISLIGDLGELLLLTSASVFFVIAILQAEKLAISNTEDT